MGGVGVRGVSWAVVAQQAVDAVVEGEVEVRAAVVVEVAPGDSLDEARRAESTLRGCLEDLGEGSVVVVVEEDARLRMLGRGLVPTKRSRKPSLSKSAQAAVWVGPR